jgi:hypothetical protein
VQSLRSEMKDSISMVQMQLTQLVNNAMVRMQAEADQRINVMLQKIVQMLNIAPRKDDDETMPSSRADVTPGSVAQVSSR